MDRKQRIIQQRMFWHEAQAKLKCISELFGAEDGDMDDRAISESNEWEAKMEELTTWIEDESPLA